MSSEMTPPRRYTTDQIVGTLREADALMAAGATTSRACRELGIPELTFYRWRHKFGGLQPDGVARLEQLEEEVALLRQIIGEQSGHIARLAGWAARDRSRPLRASARHLA